ncbi:tRNA dihydrouridine(20/20a) synthase DusA [Cyanobacterium aponinum]|uniref:tRNA-dihydrouridine(20/20a) synthase n=1 Tax=Cyanobacterium aponinum 0216 TaxID=2676140 RepID=A0A844GY36_9CHRO|nr:tRNA dihydrouridine(20/20a) synthase DusA [Cyanobacterium aponinum]MTF39931.1 tRNA dihydrouridine(20/20a) synthase DusA [Cyanobacterium aponinum 0216]
MLTLTPNSELRTPNPYYRVSIAPMMDYTDRHFRYVMRVLTKHTLLYTEMITTQAIIHGDRTKLLDFSPEEKPVALQLGGDNPQQLAECAKIGADWGYDEINLNVGCPSSRVQNGNFGACLMAQPDTVARCVEAMNKAVNIPVTVKHRIGIDDQDSYGDLLNFIKIVSSTGCDRFIVHARKAWLQGLSPKENREIPPLRYEDVYQIKQDLPHLTIEINGGIKTIEATKQHLTKVDGVMIGRAAYDNPYLFASIDQEIYGSSEPIKTREEIIESLYPYIDLWTSRNLKLNTIMRHTLQIFAGQPGSKIWKRHLSEKGNSRDAGAQVVRQGLQLRKESCYSLS